MMSLPIPEPGSAQPTKSVELSQRAKRRLAMKSYRKPARDGARNIETSWPSCASSTASRSPVPCASTSRNQSTLLAHGKGLPEGLLRRRRWLLEGMGAAHPSAAGFPSDGRHYPRRHPKPQFQGGRKLMSVCRSLVRRPRAQRPTSILSGQQAAPQARP
jgi:hypothetical protein